MGYATGLPAALAARGLTVEVVDGWHRRGSSSFAPRGAVCHWTAGARTGDRPSLKVVRDGRAGLPGPLANVFLARSGVVVVVAAGRANHAGVGGWHGLVGNSSVFGTEAESAGNGDWTDAQRWAYPRINAAFCDLGGFGPDMVCGHNEWAPNRKIDIRDWDMARMRLEVAAILEGDDMPTAQEIADAVWSRTVKRSVDGKSVRISALQELADAKTLAQTAVAQTGPIRRAGPVSLRQEVADAKTNTIALRAELAAQSALIQQLVDALAGGGAPVEIDYDRIQADTRAVLRAETVQVDVNVRVPETADAVDTAPEG
ncbi:N-acetylmuramoyl-L-alanine amidase [Cellulosimicrobium sp. SH8]|uniref:peptidoglycan recognition protein family protein n=1 Tax=Cellulosimicrobium sp. SH8 TaxID=2952936 RepID=UPI0021F2E4C2|nr:N-acetylmuramoyl-L-alanine amidase [Cellulosimicrobium sp. SH8]